MRKPKLKDKQRDAMAVLLRAFLHRPVTLDVRGVEGKVGKAVGEVRQ